MAGRTTVKGTTNALSRVWLIDGRARPDHAPSYENTMMFGAPSQDFGDITEIQIPNPNQRGKFVTIGIIRGEEGRVTADVSGIYALNLEDKLLKLGKRGLPVDFQVHFGSCKNPSVFNDSWDKILVFEDAYLTNWGTDGDLGAMESGDQASINSTTSISADVMFEILPLTTVERAGSIITNQLIDVIVADQVEGGDGGSQSDGCKRIYALSIAAGGSPSTPADVIISADGGATWRAVDVNTLAAAEDPTGIAWITSYIVVVSDDSNSLHYIAKDELDSVVGSDVWTEVTTGFVAGKQPRAVWSVGSKAYIAGNGGYVYSTTDPGSGVTANETGSAVSDDLLAIHALDDRFAVAVGNNGAIIKTTDGVSWSAITPRFVGVGVHLTSVHLVNQNVWFVGTSTGRLFRTVDGGVNWVEKAFPGSGSGVVRDVVFSNPTVGYLAHSTSTPAGRILRTINGGYDWYVLPEGSGSIAANDYVGALAACEYDVNFVVGAGLADNGTDGFLVVCQD